MVNEAGAGCIHARVGPLAFQLRPGSRLEVARRMPDPLARSGFGVRGHQTRLPRRRWPCYGPCDWGVLWALFPSSTCSKRPGKSAPFPEFPIKRANVERQRRARLPAQRGTAPCGCAAPATANCARQQTSTYVHKNGYIFVPGNASAAVVIA